MRGNTYEVTGRYMNGTVVCGYNIVDTNGENKRVTREQLIFLLGKGVISNCTGQIYGNQVIIRGLGGLNINELPIIDIVNGKVRNGSEVTNVNPSKESVSNIFKQVSLTSRIMKGKTNIGFEVRTHGGTKIRLSREEILDLASKKLVTNAVVQNYNNKGVKKKILRGVGIDIREDLPVINIG